ncbi:MAG: TIGR03546 family protein [Pirellulaceae bacterium]|nr:TIGR03546 family protein [Pirellulaceae bacterium]
MQSPQPDSTRQMPPPWRFATAVVLGLMIGLLPKESAICYLVAFCGLFLPVSLPIALVSAVIFSLLGPHLDSLTDPIGFWLLTQPWLSSLWQAVESTPGSAWLKLNNSVVVGSIAAAGILGVPTFFVANRCTRQIQALLAARPTDAVPSGPTFVTELE